MALQFTIPKGIPPKSAQTLVSGFGLPLVQRALIGNINKPDDDGAVTTSRFGTPVYDTFTFLKAEEGQWVEYTYNLKTNEYKTEDIGLKLLTEDLVIENCIIELNQAKRIVTTEVAGFDNGSVKEYIGLGDYQITLRGFFDTNSPNVYPKDQVQKLNNFLIAPMNISFSSGYLDDMLPASYDLVVSGFNFFQNQGLRNIQYFEINFITDGAFEIVSLAQ